MNPTSRLLEWFASAARPLPWREERRDSYRVLLSELMLQQTQVDRVVPLFERFVERFPSLDALAAAGEDEVVAAWSGLGYYRRARLLHRLATAVVDGRGSLPTTASALEELPGVGEYTAAAVASLAFGERIPVLDGNVLRVASRCLAFSGDPRSAAGRARLSSWVDALISDAPAGSVNEALMELGAMVCTPASPECGRCPLIDVCTAAQRGRPEDYPVPRRRRKVEEVTWVSACCVDPRGRWLVRRVEEGPILRGLWLPPYAELPKDADPLGVAR